MSGDPLLTGAEALAKTSLRPSTYRRYVKRWEELFFPLPTDDDNRKLISVTLLELLEEAFTGPKDPEHDLTFWLTRYTTSPGNLLAVAEEYLGSPKDSPGKTEFVLNLLRLAADHALTETRDEHHRHSKSLWALNKQVAQHEERFAELREWAGVVHHVIYDLVSDVHATFSAGAARINPEQLNKPE